MVLIELTEEQIKLLENGHILYHGKNTFYNLPFWFRKFKNDYGKVKWEIMNPEQTTIDELNKKIK